MKSIFALLLTLLIQMSYAQKIPQNPNITDGQGLRQGKWTIMYDFHWKVVYDADVASLYRIIEYKDGKPVGKVNDYYLNGQIQREAYLLSEDPDKFQDGEAYWYNYEGKVIQQQSIEGGDVVLDRYYRENDNIKSDIDQAVQLFGNEQFVDGVAILKRYGNRIISVYGDQPDVMDVFYTFFVQGYEAEGDEKRSNYYASFLKDNEKQRYQQYGSYLKRGIDALENENYESAKNYFIKAREEALNKYGKEHEYFIGAVRKLSEVYQALNEIDNFFSAMYECIEASEALYGAKDPGYLLLVTNYAFALYVYEKEYEEAWKLFQFVEEKLFFFIKESPSSYTGTLTNLSFVYTTLGYTDRVEEILNSLKGLDPDLDAMIEKEFVEISASTDRDISFYEVEINRYHNMQDYENTLKMALKALEIREKNKEDYEGYANALQYIAVSYFNLGSYDQSLHYYQELLETLEKNEGKEGLWYAVNLNNLASLHLKMGMNYSDVIAMRLEALKLLEKAVGKEDLNYILLQLNLGNAYREYGFNAKALPLLEASVEALSEKNPYEYATALNNLGLVEIELQLIDKAIQHFLASIEMTKKAGYQGSYLHAVSLDNLGSAYDQINKYDSGLYYTRKAVIIAESVFEDGHPNLITFYHNLAGVYRLNGQLDSAFILISKTAELANKNFGSSHPDLVKIFSERARINYWLENYEEGVVDISKAIGVFRKNYHENNSGLIHLLDTRTRLYSAQKLYTQTYESLKEAVSVSTTNSYENFSVLSLKERERQIVDTRETVHNFTLFMLENHTNHPELISENYNMILASKGILFNSIEKINEQIRKSNDPELDSLFMNWDTQFKAVAAFYQTPLFKLEENGIDLAYEEELLNTYEKELSRRSLSFSELKNAKSITWQEIQSALKPGEVSIEITRTEVSADSIIYIAFILDHESNSPDIKILKAGYRLENYYKERYHASLRSKSEDNRGTITQSTVQDSRSPYEAFWSPFLEYLTTATKVYLSNDGVYALINVEALQNPETNQFVFDEIEIERMASLTNLINDDKGATTSNEAYLFGFPDYSYNGITTNAVERSGEVHSKDKMRNFSDGNISPLPFTKIEVESISKILIEGGYDVTLYTDTAASESNIERIERSKLLHIATHGFFMDDQPSTDDAASFSMGINAAYLFENPLLRSGLLLAGAQSAVTDGGPGILTAFEVQNLNLDNTELVVLSACETGIGSIQNGEGVYGLQRAFQLAGAKAVLMSLWSVSDKATQELMLLFYKNWILNGQTKRIAFRNAQASLREKYPEPFYWAGFVLIGS